MWQCMTCGLEWTEVIAPGICPRCLAIDSYDRPTSFAAAKRAADIPSSNIPRIATGEPDVDEMLEGGFAEKSRVMLWGRGGTGKSRLAMRWASGTCNALYLSLEMLEPIAASSARSAGASLERLYFAEQYNGFSRNARQCEARIIVLDSISVVPRDEQKLLLSNLTAWAERRSGVVIVICHQNKRGQHAGSHAIQHWGDYEIFLEQRKTGGTSVKVQKSRASALAKCVTQLGSDESDDDAEANAPAHRAPSLLS